MALERDENGKSIIRLDGSMGLGPNALLTLISLDKVSGTKEETFEVPYALIDLARLAEYLNLNFILGYRLEKKLPAEASRPLVLGG